MTVERSVDPEFDDLVDLKISESLEGREEPGDGLVAVYQHLGSRISTAFAEESPRLSYAAQVHHLAQIRAQAAAKRGVRAFNFTWLRQAAPRWAQVAAVAVIVVILANGITVASASSLPGSPLYPVKRLAEQSNVLLAATPGERARVWMDLASRRLDEVQGLLASQPRVDPIVLDDIDGSILRALTEITGTRGTERIALLQEIIHLSVREQTVLDELAAKAPSDDRARFERTARLMEDVAHIAGSAQSNPGTPLSSPTDTHTPTPYPTPTSTALSTPTRTPEPTETLAPPTLVPPITAPPVESNVQVSPGTETPEPSNTKSQDGEGQNHGPAPTVQPINGDSQDGGKDVTPAPSKSQTPEREPTEADSPGKKITPDN